MSRSTYINDKKNIRIIRINICILDKNSFTLKYFTDIDNIYSVQLIGLWRHSHSGKII